MKTKDALVGFLTFLGILAFVYVVGAIDSFPEWFLLILAIITWIAYVLVVIRDHARYLRRRPLFWVKKNNKWHAIDNYGQVMPDAHLPYQRDQRKVFDQDESSQE